LALASAPPADLAGGSYGAQLLRTLIVLAAVCLLAWVVLRLVARRFSAHLGAHPSASHSPVLRVLARLPLEPRRSVYLIDAAGKTLLVGVTDTGPMTTLAELDPDTVAAQMAAAPRHRSFLQFLARGTTPKPDDVTSPAEGPRTSPDSNPSA
jgi:flagellar biosynthetic protein FliO